MKFRTLDDNWDWNIGKGRQDFSSDSLAVAYSIKTKILSWYRDCFFDMETGIDWKNILGSKVSKSDADAAIRKIITTEENVSDLLFFESTMVGRNYNCSARIKTVFGDTIEVKI
jgi:hypothetical protein|nr:MAG TPA: hypothetical protein [Caudoviricetes sp.]